MKRLVATCLFLGFVVCEGLEASWHRIASFQGKESKVTEIYEFDAPWRIRWEARRRSSVWGEPYFFLWARSTRETAPDILVANMIADITITSEAYPPGRYYFEAGGITAWWQFQIEVWDGKGERPLVSSHVRIWMCLDGRTLEAEYISSTATHVRFRRTSDNQVFDYELAKLSDADRLWVAERAQPVKPR